MPSPILTADGSHTLATADGTLYHSHHGALQESRHIFIEVGFQEAVRLFPQEDLHILEIGFGTGLNAFLTAREAEASQRPTHYHTTDLHPISEATAAGLNYPETLGGAEVFRAIHAAPWGKAVCITEAFTLTKHHLDATSAELPLGPFHAIFFDAFAPNVQPELWTPDMFTRIHAVMHPGALLTTYCSKGVVRRAMQAAGLIVEKLPGPPGKREIVRARRPA